MQSTLEKLPREEIEKRLEAMLGKGNTSEHTYANLSSILSKLRKSPKKAYVVVETLLNSQLAKDAWYLDLWDLEKDIVTDAPDYIYDFLVERAAEARCAFQLRDACRYLNLLTEHQETRNLVHRLFTTEHRNDVTLEEAFTAVRERFDSGWLCKQRPIEERRFFGPDDHLYHIAKNLHDITNYSERIIDFLAEQLDAWYPIDIVFALAGLIDTKGINENSFRIFKKISSRMPDNAQIYCRGLVTLDGSERFYESVDRWTDADRDHSDIEHLPKWLIYYKPEWVKDLDGHGWLKVTGRNPEKAQPMRNLFYFFFKGERKQATIDDVLAVADFLVEQKEWNHWAFHDLAYNLLEVVDYPEVWGFVRDEAFGYKAKIMGEMRKLCRTARIQAASPDARKAAYSFLKRKRKSEVPAQVSLEHSLRIVGKKRWNNDQLGTVLRPYGVFVDHNVEAACYLIPEYEARGLSQQRICNIGEALGKLDEHSPDFYHLIGELEPAEVQRLVSGYNALAYLTKSKRQEIIAYLKETGDEELIKSMQKSLFEDHHTKFKEWRNQLAYFQELDTAQLVMLLSRVNPLWDVLSHMEEAPQLLGLNIDPSQDIQANYRFFYEKLSRLHEKYKDFEGYSRPAVRSRDVYLVLPFFSVGRRLEIARYLRYNHQYLENIAKLKQEKGTSFLNWMAHLSRFEDLETAKAVSLFSRVQTVHSILTTASRQESLYQTMPQQTGALDHDHEMFVNDLESLLYCLVEDVLGRRVDRDSFKLTDEILEILRKYYANENQVTRDLFRDYMEDRTTLTLPEIARVSRVIVLPETQALIRQAIADYEHHIAVPKVFPVGREYTREAVHGMKERRSPAEMTELLVYGLISRDRDRVMLAGEKFDLELLKRARFFVRHATTYNEIKEDLERAQRGDEDSAKRILHYLRKEYGNVESVTDLVDGVDGLFGSEETFDYLSCRMQPGTIFDMLGSDRLMCCTFMPSGRASLFYFLDPHVGLLHLTPLVENAYIDPIGAGILAECRDDHGRKILLTDSFEGGMQIDRLRESSWKGMAYEGIMGVKEDIGAEAVAFNLKVSGVKPMKFINYVRQVTGAEPTTIYLEKVGGIEIAKKYRLRSYGFEAFGRGSGLKGNVNCILVK